MARKALTLEAKQEYQILYVHFRQGKTIDILKWLHNHFGLSLGCVQYYLYGLQYAWLPLPGNGAAMQIIEEASAFRLEHEIVPVTYADYEACRKQVERDNQLHLRERNIIASHESVVKQLTEYVLWEKKEIEAGVHSTVSAATRKAFSYLIAALNRFHRDEFDKAIIDIRRFLVALDRSDSIAYELDALAHRQTAAYLLSFMLESTGCPHEADKVRMELSERC